MNHLAPGFANAHPQRSDAQPALEEIVLLGQPSLQHYLDIVRDIVVGGETADPRAVADEWRRGNDAYHELELSEAGLADEAECHAIGPTLEPLAEELRADPHFRRTFDVLPTEIAMVELDKLVAFQTQVTRHFIESVQAQIGPNPDPQRLFRLCLPTGKREVPIEIRRTGSRRWSFSSDSTDLRFLEAILLQAGHLSDFASYGPVAGVVGLVVGFGSNMLNVIRSDTRMLLNNGYHRACALRALGVTHAPCVVQTVTRRAELAVVGPQRVCDDAAFYFKAARPPLLRDFFDPRVSKVLPIRRVRKVVEVSFETKVFDVAD